MNPEALLTLIVEIIGSRLSVIVFSVIVIVMVFRIMRQKSNKLKLLMADARFNNARFFHGAIKSPIAVSPDGYIGIVLETVSQPIVIQIKDITEFRMMSDDCVIARGDKGDPEGIFSKEATATVEQSIRVKTKRINMLLSDKDGLIYNIPLLISSLKKRIIPTESLQNEIKGLLNTLEEVGSIK